jgi:ABC-type protease/lipase transport system fused ATPase/permease subunit
MLLQLVNMFFSPDVSNICTYRYGNPNASDADMLRALESSKLARQVASWDTGMETLVGERGLKLSGGEKQRVAIARGACWGKWFLYSFFLLLFLLLILKVKVGREVSCVCSLSL